MTARHAFFAAPFYADRCDFRVEDDGQRRQCAARPNDPIHLGVNHEAVAVTPLQTSPQEPSTDQTGSTPPRFYFWRNEREPNTWFVTTFTKEKIAEMEAENADLRERLEGTEASAEDEGDAHAETLRLLRLREQERDEARAELAVTLEPDAYRRLHEQASRGRAAADEIAALKIHVAKLQRRLTREPPVAYREPTWAGAVLDALDLLTRDRIPDLARYTDRMPPRMGMLIRTIRERTLAILDSADEALTALAAAQKRIEALADVLTDCGYTDKEARVAAVSLLDGPALASPSESAPQPTPETRVDLEALLQNATVAIEWAVKDDYDFGGSLRSPTLMALNAVHLKIKQYLDTDLARRAAPTGQQQEAGALELAAAKKENSNLRKWLQWMQEGMSFHAANVELHALAALAAFGMIPDARSTAVVSLTGTQGAALDELRDALRGEPMDEEYKGRVAEFKRAAAPPSAPQEGLAEQCETCRALDKVAALAHEFAEFDPNRGALAIIVGYVAEYQHAHRQRALPLPESALTKAAPVDRKCVDCKHPASAHTNKYESEEPGEFKFACSLRECECDGLAFWAAPAAPLTQPAVPEKEVPTEPVSDRSGLAATPGVTLKEGVAPALGTCSFDDGGRRPHGRTIVCVNWRPVDHAAPAPVETGREDRCSACGSQRILQDDGTLGACGFLECKDPMADYRLENPSSGAV